MTGTNHDSPMTNAAQPVCPCGTRLPSVDPDDYPTFHDMYLANPYAVRADHAEHRAQREPTRTAQSLEENTMQIAFTLTVEVDATAWAEAYGTEPADLRADVLNYLRTHVDAATAPLSVIDAHHA